MKKPLSYIAVIRFESLAAASLMVLGQTVLQRNVTRLQQLGFDCFFDSSLPDATKLAKRYALPVLEPQIEGSAQKGLCFFQADVQYPEDFFQKLMVFVSAENPQSHQFYWAQSDRLLVDLRHPQSSNIKKQELLSHHTLLVSKMLKFSGRRQTKKHLIKKLRDEVATRETGVLYRLFFERLSGRLARVFVKTPITGLHLSLFHIVFGLATLVVLVKKPWAWQGLAVLTLFACGLLAHASQKANYFKADFSYRHWLVENVVRDGLWLLWILTVLLGPFWLWPDRVFWHWETVVAAITVVSFMTLKMPLYVQKSKQRGFLSLLVDDPLGQDFADQSVSSKLSYRQVLAPWCGYDWLLFVMTVLVILNQLHMLVWFVAPIWLFFGIHCYHQWVPQKKGSL